MPVRLVPVRDTPRRIAIVKPSALGDVMHALPVSSGLRRRFPDAHIAWVVNHIYAPLLTPHPELNEVIPFDRNSLRSGWLRGRLLLAASCATCAASASIWCSTCKDCCAAA